MKKAERFQKAVVVPMRPRPRRTARFFPLWGMVPVGGKGADDYFAAMVGAGYHIPLEIIEEVFLKARTAALPVRKLRLVAPSVEELGFKEDAAFQSICDAGIAHGYRLVLEEVAFAAAIMPRRKLRARDALVRLAMSPILDKDGDLRILGVPHRKDDADWLRGYDGRPGRLYHKGIRFLFEDPSR